MPPQPSTLALAAARMRSAGCEVSSLSASNGVRCSVLVSSLIVASHLAFLYAQLGGQEQECGFQDPKSLVVVPCPKEVHFDGLLAGIIKLHADFDAGSAAALALETLTTSTCYGQGRYVDCPSGRETAVLATGESATDSLCTLLECSGATVELPVLHLSYWYSIVHLWEQPGPTEPPGCDVYHSPPPCVATSYPGRAAAAALFIFSFIWPHVKLFLLHAYYYAPLGAARRRNGLYWFSFFGKWSLADVLVMCCVIGLFNLDVDMALVQLWQTLDS